MSTAAIGRMLAECDRDYCRLPYQTLGAVWPVFRGDVDGDVGRLFVWLSGLEIVAHCKFRFVDLNTQTVPKNGIY